MRKTPRERLELKKFDELLFNGMGQVSFMFFEVVRLRLKTKNKFIKIHFSILKTWLVLLG
jgi:hypothetical protein